MRPSRRSLLRGGLILLYLVIGLAIGARYVAPGELPADAGELQLVARELGVAHPPGYPLYTLAAHAFGRVVVPDTSVGAGLGTVVGPLLSAPCSPPANLTWSGNSWISPSGALVEWDPFLCIFNPVGGWWSWSTNLFSLLLALITLGVVFHAGRRLGGSWTAGLLGAAVLLAMPVFVQQATTANIRMPTALLTAAVIALSLRWLAATEEGEPPPRQARGLAGWLGDTRLHGLALALGLAASHHVSLVFLTPVVVSVLLVRRPWLLAPRQLRPLVVAGAIGLLPLLYLPMRGAAGALLAPADLTTLDGFWRHVTGANFRGDLRLFDDPIALWDRTLVVFDLFLLQLGWPGLLLVAIGSLWLVARRRSAAWLLLGIVATFSALAIWYRAPQTVEYLMPAHVAMAMLAAAAGGAILSFREHALVSSPPLRRAGVVALAVAIAAQTLATARDVRAAHPRMTEIVERTIGPNDCDVPVLASWHYATPLWLGQHVSDYVEIRSDFDDRTLFPHADTRYVHPEGAEPIGETWLRRAEAATAEHGAVILTNRSAEILASDLALWPLLGTPFWSTAPDPCGGEADWIELIEDNRALGRLQLDMATTWIHPAFGRLAWVDPNEGPAEAPTFSAPPASRRRGAVRLVAAARPAPHELSRARNEVALRFETITAFDGPATVVAQLVDPDTGTVHGQFDRGFPAARWNDPRGLELRADLHRHRGPRPARLALQVGIYHQSSEGTPGVTPRWNATAGTLTDSWRPSVRFDAVASPPALVLVEQEAGVDDPAPPPGAQPNIANPTPQPQPSLMLPPSGAIPFGDAMTLLGSEVHRDGDELRVDLRWLAERAYRSDYTISVQATAEGGHFAQSDGTPAVGAYPTLKWLPGQRVRDRHRIALPADWPRDEATRVSVGVYDAFSLEPLPITDGERVRTGQGQRAIVFDAVLP